VSETAARLPSAIAGVGCVGLTVLLGRWLLGNPTSALLAAGLLATSFRFAFTARRAQLDVLLTALELLAIAVFVPLEFIRNVLGSGRDTPACRHDTLVAGRERPLDPRPSRLVIAGLHTALGAAALVKGPVAWLPLAIIATYLAWEGRIRTFHAIAPAWAWSLSLGPICLWMLAAIALAPPGFAEVAVGENLIGRFFAGKRGLYLLPLFPALSLMAALGVTVLGGAKTLDPRTTRRAGMMIAIVAGLELVLFAIALPHLNPDKSPRPIAIAAARATRPKQAVGVYGLRPIEGAIAYYGDRRVASLRDEDELRAFLARGGSTILLRARDFEELGPSLGLDRPLRFRSGRRELVLASSGSPSPRGSTTPKPADGAIQSPQIPGCRMLSGWMGCHR